MDRDDVPGVFWDDEGGEEVDFRGEVGDGASAGAAVSVDAAEAVEKLGGTLDLDAVKRVVSGARNSRFLAAAGVRFANARHGSE